MTDNGESHVCARVVSRYRSLGLDDAQFRLFAFGYDMDKMKARCWYETTYPLITLPAAVRIDFSRRVQALTVTAELIAGMLRQAVKRAWFDRPGEARGDTAFLKQYFFQHTESAFYRAVTALKTDLPAGTDGGVADAWHGTLRRGALDLFDVWSARGDVTRANPRRIAAARTGLQRRIDGKAVRAALHPAGDTREAA